MRRLLLAIALPTLLAPAAAEAAVRHVVRGAGWGHGIGMSQFGALGFANNGRNYEQILRHYYRGTDLSKADTRTIRVLLQSSRTKKTAFSGATRIPGRRLDPDRTYEVTREGFARVALRSARGKLLETADSFRVTSSSGVVKLHGTAINGVVNGRYRDALELRPGLAGGVTVVNAVGLDEYVQGVLPGEMPSSWPGEALKAQAVAARSYALVTDAGGPIFDQYPDTRSQVYRGADHEQPRANAAVKATAGEVLRHDGQIAVTYFFSTSGGRTENVENVFYAAAPRPYLVSVEDPYDGASPRHRWRLRFTTRQMQSKLGALVQGRFRRIRVVQRGRSPRIVWAEVIGSRGTTRVRGATLRARLGLYDTWASFTKIRTDSSATAIGSSWLSRLARPRALFGEIAPRPRRRALVVERQDARGAWRRAHRGRLARSGSYRVMVGGGGMYRVRAGAIVGPAVRVP